MGSDTEGADTLEPVLPAQKLSKRGAKLAQTKVKLEADGGDDRFALDERFIDDSDDEYSGDQKQ